MKIIIADVVINLDAVGILERTNPARAEHWLVAGNHGPVAKFPTEGGADSAMDAIQDGVRMGCSWIELDAITGHCINGCADAWESRLPKFAESLARALRRDLAGKKEHPAS